MVGSMRTYIVKKNHLGSEVSEILRYKQTHIQTNSQAPCYFYTRMKGKNEMLNLYVTIFNKYKNIQDKQRVIEA